MAAVGARAEPTLIVGEGGDLPYLKDPAQASYYLPIGEAAARCWRRGCTWAASSTRTVDQVPASRRFYAGGGGSVRGFAYQGVGPQLADNTPQGGMSLVEGSLEVRHDLTAKWGVVAFVDAGAVGSDPAPGVQDLSVGAGLGVRYNLGFGPIRVDVAIPGDRAARARRPFQIYISIGQSF